MDTGLSLLYGVKIPAELIFKPIAQIAGHDRLVFVVDGENSFRAYLIARYARELRLSVQRTLSHVKVSRAFTCYQLTELVIKLGRLETGQCAGIVCLGLLGTFYDEDVNLPEAQRLLQQVIAQLEALAKRLPILITVRPPASTGQDRTRLVDVLLQHANTLHVLRDEPAGDRPIQIQLALKAGRPHGPH